MKDDRAVDEVMMPQGIAPSTLNGPEPFRHILGMRVDATNYQGATERIVRWAKQGQSRYVCVATVNNVMQARDDALFLDVMNHADLNTSDGMPLVWGLRWLGARDATRVYGPDLTAHVLSLAEEEGVRVGFFGGNQEVLQGLVERVRRRWPRLRIAYAYSPPFRPLSRDEDEQIVRDLNDSGTQILFVGLGCPKQERWMAGHRGSVSSVMVGVGAAFDYLAGRKKQAPSVLQRAGLEWLFRLATEPRRLWKRYIRQNPRFVLLFGWQLLRTSLPRRVNRIKVRGERT